jgi:predicted secreted protein
MAQFFLDQTNNGGETTVHVGDEIRVALAENGSTGYRWQVSLEGDGLKQIVSTYDADGAVRPGEGGKRNFILRAEVAGATTIDARSVRSWRPQQASGSFRHLVRIMSDLG